MASDKRADLCYTNRQGALRRGEHGPCPSSEKLSLNLVYLD